MSPNPVTERAPRADARRNRERILAAAHDVFREEGPDASLGEIARRAGVGIGTLYRHFPDRHALLDALFGESAMELCAQGEAMRASESPRDAFVAWMRASLEHALTFRSLAASLMISELGDEAAGRACSEQSACSQLRGETDRIVQAAREAGVLRADVDADDVIRLVNAIALATEDDPDPRAVADRLFHLMIGGVLA
jgi:AcrR family transcriptional regulator